MKIEKTNTVATTTSLVNNRTKALGEQCSPNQGGFGALEVMIALMIGAIVIIGAVAWYAKLTNNSNNGDELSNISSLLTNTRQLKTASGYGASGTDLIPTLLNGGGVPDNMQKSGGAVFNAWDGAVTIKSTGTGFTLTYAGLPPQNCIFFATKASNSSSITTSINGGTPTAGEITSVAASAACTGATNTVSWAGR